MKIAKVARALVRKTEACPGFVAGIFVFLMLFLSRPAAGQWTDLVPHVVPEIGGAVPGGSGTYAAFTVGEPGAFGGKVKTGSSTQPAVFGPGGDLLLETGTAFTRLGQPSGDAVIAETKSGFELLTGLASGSPSVVAQTGAGSASAPGIKSFLAIDGNGADTFFLAALQGIGVTAANNEALEAVVSGSASIVARKGWTVAIDGTSKVLKVLTTFGGSAGTTADGRWRAGDASFGIRATFEDKSQALFLVPAVASGTGAGNWQLIAETGTVSGIAGLTGAVVTAFGLPAFSGSGAVYRVSLATNAGGIGKGDNVAIISGTTVLAQKGKTSADSNGAPLGGVNYAALSDPVCGTDGAAAFYATLAGIGVNPLNNEGIWFSADGRTPKRIARKWDWAPVTGGHYTEFTSMVLPPYTSGSDGPLFTATLAIISADGISAKNNAGLWAVDATGAVQLLYRTGTTVTVNGASRKVQNFGALIPAAGSTGAASGYNSQGDIAILAGFGAGVAALLDITAP